MNFGLTSGIGVTGNVSFSQSFQFPYISAVTSTSFSSSCSTVLEGNNEGMCQWPAITTTYKHVVEYIYKENCDFYTPDEQVGNPIHYFIPMNHCLRNKENVCFEYNICEPLDGGIRVGENNQIASRDKCSTILEMNVINPEKIYSYIWVMPDGTQIESGNEIYADQVGLYQCIVSDKCCVEEIFEYYLCDKMIYGDWMFSNGVYCNTFDCKCESSEKAYTICITPQRYDESWSFDNTRLKCTKHAYWTDQNGEEIDLTNEVNEADIDAGDINVVKDSIIEDYFDNTTKQCVKDYYCDVDESTEYYEQSEPLYGEWEYDDIFEKCYREVFCFDNEEPAEDENGWEVNDEGSAEIEWDFNQDLYICYGSVFCDNDETEIEIEEEPNDVWYWEEQYNECMTSILECDNEIQENISESAADVGDWEYDGDGCVRDVYCETANETFEDVVYSFFWYDANNYADCNADDGEYSYQVVCGTDETDIYVCRDNPPGEQQIVHNNDFKSNNPKRLELNNYKYYKIFIYSIDGKSRKVQGVKRVSDVDEFVSLFKKYKAQKNIMYFYTVYGENELLYSKKFFIARK